MGPSARFDLTFHTYSKLMKVLESLLLLLLTSLQVANHIFRSTFPISLHLCHRCVNLLIGFQLSLIVCAPSHVLLTQIWRKSEFGENQNKK